ncbi:MAG: LysM peptidoglycan-binding domain-containing protein [Anaerolineaceae bacterium]
MELRRGFLWFSCLLLLSGCIQPAPDTRPWLLNTPETTPLPTIQSSTVEPTMGPTSTFPATIPTFIPTTAASPTPDEARPQPTLRSETEYYTVQAGDSLAIIAARYNMPVNVLINANSLINPNYLEVGQSITIPSLAPSVEPSVFKILPDSELVYGPYSAILDVTRFIHKNGGYLSSYSEKVDDIETSGADIVMRIAYEYSVNPRLLLAFLEYQSGWVTQMNPDASTLEYPIRLYDSYRKGLYRQLAWAANQLNRGYYMWKSNNISYLVLTDSNLVTLPAEINAGTAGIQAAFATLDNAPDWKAAVSVEGFYATYIHFFGIPFDYSIEPVVPQDLQQPAFLLPFEPGVTWYLTGGPHASWGDGSAWGALDFAPPEDQYGCFSSNAWVTAVADGIITRASNGEVILDLDGDGLEQTGWVVLYMHIESRDRVAVGTKIKAGDRIGHASCEGGISTGTHFHIARRYNGEWIPATGELPFNFEGWTPESDGIEYNGTLSRDGVTVTAWEGRIAANAISH